VAEEEEASRSADRSLYATLAKRSSGTWGADDHDVMQGDREIGRIFKPRARRPGASSWVWTITGAMVIPRLPSHGFCANLDEAKAKFARG
jgi:hypothetical protein